MIAPVVLMSIFSGCASRPIPAVNESIIQTGARDGATVEQLRRGRELLVTTCAYCHVPVDPRSISMERWDRALPRMVEKAELPMSVQADIRAYVMAARAAAPTEQ